MRLTFPFKNQANKPPAVQHSKVGNSKILSTEGSTPGRIGELPALIAVIGCFETGKTTFVNNASGSRLETTLNHGIRASNEFELDGQRVVLIDTPGFHMNSPVCSNNEDVMKLIKKFLAESYPTGTKLTGIIFVHDVGWSIGTSLESRTGTMEELCEGSTLKNFVIMIHQWDKVTRQAEELLQSELSSPSGFVQEVVRRGAKIYRCTGTSEPDLGALRIILGGGSVALDKEVKDLRRELEEQKRRPQEEADVFKKRATEMQRQVQEEADELKKCISQLQSKLEEDRHTSACLPLDLSSPQFANRLDKALHGQEYAQCVENFREGDLVWFVDYLDKALDSLDPLEPASRKCLRELGSICAAHTTLPRSYAISSRLTVESDPFASGGFGEVYQGTLDGSSVCVKRLRAVIPEDFAVSIQMFCKEAVMWKTLKHPNILPLLGAIISPPQLVSIFMPAGDLSKYLQKNPDANRLGLLSEIAEGLCYLHTRNVIHGDLKGTNVLVEVIDNIPHARIADFGVTTVTKNLDSIRTETRHDVHSPRWSAPEIIHEQNPSKESDVYSFAMVVIEVLTGKAPFSNKKTNWMVVQTVLKGDRPSRPEHPSCTDGLWALIQRCWDQDPGSRPEILEVSQMFSPVSKS